MKFFNFLLIALCLGCYRNPIERNTIVFKDNPAAVGQSLLRISELLDSLPDNPDGYSKVYRVDVDSIYFNTQLTVIRKRTISDTIKSLAKYNSNQKSELFHHIYSLKKNYITSAYFDKDIDLWVFEYRSNNNQDYDDNRSIVIAHKMPKVLYSKYQIIQSLGDIHLLVYKGARIR